MACQMADAKTLKTTIMIHPERTEGTFNAKGEVITFPGFMAVYSKDDAKDEGILPTVTA